MIQELGILLRFDPIEQCLLHIRMAPAANPIILNYNGETFKDANASATCFHLMTLFPPTMLGRFVDEERSYEVDFESGISLKFKINNDHSYESLRNKKEHPIGTPKESPLLTSLEVSYASKTSARAFSIACVDVCTGDGISICLPGSQVPVFLPFNSGIQDVLATLGPPEASCGSTLNFFRYGIDVTFDNQQYGSVHKVTIHSNYPGHILFGRYHKALFRISGQRRTTRLEMQKALPLTKLPDLIEIFESPSSPLVVSDGSISYVRHIYSFGGGISCDVTESGAIATLQVACQ
jgi:hypothetical protein